MSFGFSLGDFLTAIELANRIRARFVDAPDQFKAVSDEVKSLSNVLRDIDDVLPQRDLADQQKTELGEITQGCRDVLKELEDTLDKYQELDPSTKGLGGRSRRVWKRFRWDQKDIDRFRSRITSNVLLFNTFLGRIINQTTFAVKDGVDRLISRQHDQDRQNILDWLTPINYGAQQSDFIGRRQEGTGQWLLNSDEFQKWSNENNQTLFCPGIPGAGKTMLTCIVVDYLETQFANNANVGIAYLYFNFRQEQKSTDLLASLLKQLIQEQSSLPESVRQLYMHHKGKQTRPSFDEISKALHSVVANYSKIFIIMDALDECQASDGGRKRLLSEVHKFQAKTEASLFATSRFIPEIVKEFEGSISLEIRADDEDVRNYLKGHISRLPSCVTRSLDLQKEIETKIIKVVEGMFLLAQLHLDSLIDKTTPRAIRRALEKLPKGSDALDQAYGEAMQRIQSQEAGFHELAKRVLSWISCARRRLTTLELRHALAVEIGDSEFSQDNLQDIGEMVSVCAGLVTVDEESDIIRLVHYTTQEYFERTWTSVFPNAQEDIANSCVTYLSFNDFEAGFCLTDEKFEERLKLYPFYKYAARNWGHHVNAASPNVQHSILEFLENEAKVFSSSQAMTASNEYYYGDYSQRVPKQITGIHLAAYFGLREITLALLKNRHRPDIKDSEGRTPLSWAAYNGHEAVVRLLLTRADVEADSKDKNRHTPLWRAADSGHEVIVRLLLTRVDVEADSKDKNGWTPLSRAANRGHETVVRLLLERVDVEADSKDKYGKTSLWWAAEYGHETIVRLLLARADVEADSKDKNGRTPLWQAVHNGHEAVVRLLLARADVEADPKDKDGRTPLWWAAYKGHTAVVRLLLARADVEADLKDKKGETPLRWAAYSGHEAVVRLLLARADVEADSKDKDGQTPLS